MTNTAITAVFADAEGDTFDHVFTNRDGESAYFWVGDFVRQNPTVSLVNIYAGGAK